ncbi:hypothetical protein MNBD_ALPHA01-801 [hydrothermal vent metagenome]|uniref:Peptidase S9 prolyl oligopeptidase catalytic domain-containing protein n=1 Tax=hydrothermal vent metagenome TaxID=652676 RepID=A0A3B0RWI2_9ZZZZ
MFRCFFLFLVIYPFGFLPAFGADRKLSISAEAFGQLENFKSIKLSPDGNRMASLRNYRGKITLITQSMDPAEKGQWYVISVDEGEYKWFKWLTNDRLAVSVRFPDSDPGIQYSTTRLYAIDWNKQNPKNLVKSRRARSQFQDRLVSRLPDDPDHILLALDDKRQNYPYVYKINIHTAKRKRVVTIASHITDWMADKKGVVRIGFGHYKTRNRIIYRQSADDPWEKIADYDAVDDQKPFHPLGFSPDPKVIYVSKADENGFQAIYAYNYEMREFIEKIAGQDGADISGLELDDKGNLLSYSYYDDNYHIIHKDKLYQRIARMTARFFPDQQADIVSRSKDKKKFIIKVSSPVNPGDYYFLDLNSNKIDWFSESYPGLDDDKLSPMQSVRYPARDGLEIPAYLSLPVGVKDAKNLPTVILPHGGPFARDYYGFDYWVQFLTTRGYAVLQMNYRGSTGLGNDFETAGHKEWGGRMLDDINDGARWMIEQGHADPARICIMGGSYGGYAALQSLVREPGLYKCSVAFAPVTSMLRLYNNFNKFFGTQRYVPYIRDDNIALSDLSPHSNIDKITVPVLLAHGTGDRIVNYRHGETFAKRMKKKNKDIRFITFEDGDHYLSLQKHRIKFLREVEKFLEKNL